MSFAPLRVFIGYDPREAVAYHVCVNSLIRHASCPLAITPLALNCFPEYREKHEDGSNAFIYSRFLVPYLCGFNGPALYIDGDMIVRDDIAKIFAMNLADKDVMVVKHDYKTKFPVKHFGNKNEDYPCKNWSSVILWNCGNYPNRKLIPEFVEMQSGEYLHRFQWTSRIGELSPGWNHLVGEYETNQDAKILHYTIAIPPIQPCGDEVHAAQWWDEFHLSMEANHGRTSA